MVINGDNNPNTLNGTASDDSISGFGGNDTINALGGIDTVYGGVGDDLLIVNFSSLTGTHLIFGPTSAVSYAGGNTTYYYEIEKVYCTATSGDDYLEYFGSSFHGRFNGMAGYDYITGVDLSAHDLDGGIFDNTGGNVTYGDTTFQNIEAFFNITLGGGADRVTLKGDYDDILHLGNGNDIVDAGQGQDDIYGEGGEDYLIVDYSGDAGADGAMLNFASDGTVGCYTSLHSVEAYSIERIRMTGTVRDDTFNGGTGNDTLIGLGGADRFDGGGGANRLQGGTGNDTFVIDSIQDTLVELADEGSDTVESSINFTLQDNFENLTLLPPALIARGNALPNQLNGNELDNTLDGKAGIDTMAGSAGSDTYLVDRTSDSIVEFVFAGTSTDVVKSTANYTLPDNVEDLFLFGAEAVRGTGNDAANKITGNAQENVLDGGPGDDVLIGGAGNDTYLVNSSLDKVRENSTDDIDQVRATASFTLGANVERLALLGGGNLEGMGNVRPNQILGNAGANTLGGGADDDTLSGGAGIDRLTGADVGNRGVSEVDRLTGGGDGDIFVLGTAAGKLYNDAADARPGLTDFAYIVDFTVGADQLQLHGRAGQYRLGASPVEELNGKGLFLETGETDELIAIIHSANGTSLTNANTISTAVFT